MPYIGKSPGKLGVRTRFYYTATGGETSKSGADDNGLTLKFDDGEYVDVYLNGVLLVAGTDYNTSTANTISGLTALVASDILEVIVYDIYSLAKTNSEAQRTKYYVTATGGETSISGTDDNGATITFSAGAQIDLRLNGVSLKQGDDYNTTVANTVGGLTALTAGQLVEIVVYEKFVLADMVKKSGDTMTGSLTAPSINTTGNVDIGGSLLVDTIKEGTGTNTAMTIDSNGNILKPNLICFDYYLSANQNLTNSAWTKLTFNTKAFERGGNNFNTTDNRFVAPIDGIYMFTTQVNHHTDTSASGYQYSGFYKNGSPYRYTSGLRIQNQQIKADHTQTGSVMMELSANDYVEVFAYADASTTPVVFGGIGRCGFSGYLVG